MSKREELAWQELKLAEERFTDAAIVIADNVVFEGKQSTAAEIAELCAAKKAFILAHREYVKAIKMEADK